MATRTTNFGLYKPDPTDDYVDFLSEFNDNMDEIDGHLGGGGGGNVYGAFVDTNRVIASGQHLQTWTYTATEDCFVVTSVAIAQNTSANCQIDGVTTSEWYNTGSLLLENIEVYLRKGQTFTVNGTTSATSNYFVYGLTQGTDNIFAPIIYSDTERVVGVWRDNKPLYQKTWDLGSDLTVNANSWTNTAILVSDFNIEKIVNVGCINSGGTLWDFVGANCDQAYVQLLQTRTTAITVRYVTLCYTKTIDSAGSGNWNVDGIPAVHYSTSEQVIGTWTDGKPLYQTTVDVPTPVNDSNEHLIDLTALSIEECPYLFGYAVRHSGANDITYYSNSIETDGWYYFKARYDNFRDSITYTCLFRNDSISRMKFTIQYTKTTD